jgi:hypothetical protein
MKITNLQLDALYELSRRIPGNGAVITSHWTTGAGRWTRRRAIPPFCKRIERWQSFMFPKRIRQTFNAHPQCQAVIAIVDMRNANKALKNRV